MDRIINPYFLTKNESSALPKDFSSSFSLKILIITNGIGMNQDMTNYDWMKVFKKLIANTLLVQKRNPKPNRNGAFVFSVDLFNAYQR